MGDLQDPYGAAAGLSPPAAAAEGGAGEAAEEEDMRGGEGQARRWRKRGRARWRRWAGAEAGLRAGEKMVARRVAIRGARLLFYKGFCGVSLWGCRTASSASVICGRKHVDFFSIPA